MNTTPLEVYKAGRKAFLETCDERTRLIHEPLSDLVAVGGSTNPNGLAIPDYLQGPPRYYGAYLFKTYGEYKEADRTKVGVYGSGEYGVCGSKESKALAHKVNNLYGGAGAVITPSGLSAIEVVLHTFLKDNSRPIDHARYGLHSFLNPKKAYLPNAPRILLPDNGYSPLLRELKRMKGLNQHLSWDIYPSEASGDFVRKMLNKAQKQNRPYQIVYLEAPGSHCFKIADIEGIAAAAKEFNAVSVLDNSWASVATELKPLEHVDVAVEALTKYANGYGDGPLGAIAAKDPAHAGALAFTAKAKGMTTSPVLCSIIDHRMDSVVSRMKQHFDNAQTVIEFFQDLPEVKTILAPQINAPGNETTYARFNEYFGTGNGMFTVVFNDNVSEDQIIRTVDKSYLFHHGESWGARTTQALFVNPKRKMSDLPDGVKLRLSIGLEDPEDLIRDWKQAAAQDKEETFVSVQNLATAVLTY